MEGSDDKEEEYIPEKKNSSSEEVEDDDEETGGSGKDELKGDILRNECIHDDFLDSREHDFVWSIQNTFCYNAKLKNF